MKKRIVVGIMAMTLCLSLIGCGKEAASEPTTNVETETEAETGAEPVAETQETAKNNDGDATLLQACINYNGKEVSLNDDANSLVEKLGEPDKKEEQDSCVDYIYSGLRVQFFKDGDQLLLVGIYGEDKTASSSAGIAVGSSYKDVVAVYGDASYEDEISGGTDYCYAGDDFTTTFTVKGDVVEAIAITAGRG